MATYAAFKHVELYNVGKAKKRVLRPPGGGTSDIFGGDSHQTPRPVKNHMKSNIFAHEAGAVKNNGDQPRRGQKNIDSYSRLFGEPERPFTPAKNHMKSSIPFGPNSEGAQPVLTNGTNGHNGHNHHTNGKSGSVSSASSSVSSSTENLKMNGISKTAAVETCPKEKSTSTEDIPAEIKSLSMDQPCDDKSFDEKSVHAANIEAGAGDVITQTRRDTGVDAPNPHSLAEQKCLYEKKEEPLESCALKKTLTILRNPITGLGLGEDGVGGWRPIKTKQRDGNPVTGEGYKVDNTPSTPSMNGVNQVINKNRIPPGGYSSGLW